MSQVGGPAAHAPDRTLRISSAPHPPECSQT